MNNDIDHGRRGWMQAAWLAALGMTSTHVAAQDYPARPVRLIVPYPPGGIVDAMTRVFVTELGKRLGQPVVVDYKPGAGAIIGTDALAKATPDGHTIGLLTTQHAINPLLFERLPYDSRKDFELISWMATAPYILVAGASANIKTFPQLLATAKANPGTLNYASLGPGSAHNILTEWICRLAGISMAHIPYKGGAPAMQDLLGGQVHIFFTGATAAAEHVKNGRLIALATTSPVRLAVMPEVPPIADFLPRFEVSNIGYGIGAPAGLPRDVAARLNNEIRHVLTMPDVRQRFEEMGAIAKPTTLQEGATFLYRDVELWKNILKEAGINVQMTK